MEKLEGSSLIPSIIAFEEELRLSISQKFEECDSVCERPGNQFRIEISGRGTDGIQVISWLTNILLKRHQF